MATWMTHLRRGRDVARCSRTTRYSEHDGGRQHVRAAKRRIKAGHPPAGAGSRRHAGVTGSADRKPAASGGAKRQRWRWAGRSCAGPGCSAYGRAKNLTLLREHPSQISSDCKGRLSTTTVYVTHDQVEAMTMGDRVAVLKDGVLQ